MARPKSAKAKAARALTDPNNANNAPLGERPAKKVKLLDHSDDEPDSDAEGITSLKVNDEYARRFEFNNKRKEKQQLEEKYANGKRDESEEDSEDGVEEDDDGDLATETLDAQISATLQALRSKDPRVYDSSVTFYQPIDDEDENGTGSKKQEKAMTLKDYHTKNLLEGRVGGEYDEDVPLTFAQEQEEIRQNLLKDVHAEAGSEEEDDDFLVAKPKPKSSKKEGIKKITHVDIKEADKDPETFLSNFMASRAWVPTDKASFQPLESDDEDDEDRAEEFEAAYNRYFEETAGANEKLVTYARDAVATTTVRRDGPNGRKRARDLARAKREAERQEREADLARLRKLKIDEMEEKVKTIRKIGGFTGRDFKMEEWSTVLEEDWSDDQWDEEMRKRFGDSYYDATEGPQDSEQDDEATSKKKPKKPKFDDDIDIKDLIPDFDDEELEKPTFTLSDDEDDALEDHIAMGAGEEEAPEFSAKTSKKRKQERADAKSNARRDRRLIESLVDSNLEYEAALAAKAKAPTRFRYRETSPTTFGLTPRDILLANDTQLNDFAGLKKLASFREPEKKKKDKKHLSKKARIRQWRTDTFGNPEGPKGGFEVLLGGEAGAANADEGPGNGGELVDIREGKKKKKRSRKRKAGEAEI